MFYQRNYLYLIINGNVYDCKKRIYMNLQILIGKQQRHEQIAIIANDN